jgi:hypothetical protein
MKAGCGGSHLLIPALGRLRQEDLKVSMGYIVRFCLKKQTNVELN